MLQELVLPEIKFNSLGCFLENGFVLEFGLVESSKHLVAEISTCQTTQAVVLPVCASDSNHSILRIFNQLINCCLHVFLGPSGTDQAIPVAANDVSVADPPAQNTNAADKGDKQSIQKHRLFFF